MKTVVLGLFDDLDGARRVLAQLAASPLDMEAVEVIHADSAVQGALAAEAGLPPARAVPTAGVFGALLGGALGALAGTGPLAAVGQLLATAAGALVGGAVGLAAGAFSTNLRLPPVHTAAVLEALQSGATVLVVRTDNLPTARAIRDLFQACGSRELPQIEGEEGMTHEPEIAGTAGMAGTAPGTLSPGPADHTFLADHAAAADYTLATDQTLAADHTLFAPRPAGSPGPAADQPEHTIFAPPWRRGVQAPEPAEDAAWSGPQFYEAPIGAHYEAPIGAPPDQHVPAEPPDIDPADVAGYIPPPSFLDPWTGPSGTDTLAPVAPGPVAPLPVARIAEHDLATLGLSSRIAGMLVMAGITSRADLEAQLARGDDALLAIHGIGPAALTEIRQRLAAQPGRLPSPSVAAVEASQASDAAAAAPTTVRPDMKRWDQPVRSSGSIHATRPDRTVVPPPATVSEAVVPAAISSPTVAPPVVAPPVVAPPTIVPPAVVPPAANSPALRPQPIAGNFAPVRRGSRLAEPAAVTATTMATATAAATAAATTTAGDDHAQWQRPVRGDSPVPGDGEDAGAEDGDSAPADNSSGDGAGG